MIYDCFTFFNELDLLEIRLNILSPFVDKFVLVEATKTHQGKEKPLHFADNKKRFEKFFDKIIHVVVDEYPDYEGKSPWVLEHHQRNMIMKGLTECKNDDIILISDLDEIPSPEKISEYKNKKGIKIFRQKMFYYFFNCINVSHEKKYRWNGTVMLNYNKIKAPQDFREMSLRMLGLYHIKFTHRVYWHLNKFINFDIKGYKAVFINDGGWHFSYLGGVESIIKKLESFAHSEYNKDEFKDAKNIEAAINSGKDILGRNFKYKIIDMDNTYPKYILDNLEKYKNFIKL